MRELQLAGAGDGIETVFDDLETLARNCRFSDCAHETEPGCAIQAALQTGTLDAARLLRWQKLKREDAHNNRSLAETRAKDKQFGKMVKGIMKQKRRDRR